MDAEQFVDRVRKSVMEGAVDDTLAILLDPPGRRPAPQLVAISEWYRGLAANDREMVGRALALASHGAVFGVFAILDGARRIDDEPTPVGFQLWSEGKEGRKLLSGGLHDLVNSENWYR